MENEIKFSRIWAMPNANTFQIKPIKRMVEKYVKGKKVIIDPFANESKYGTITNDLNTKFDTDYHLDALDFLRKMKSSSADMVLFDPPFSLRQASECYKKFGYDKLTRNITNGKYWSDVKKEIGRICQTDGIVLSCGWNSSGIGKGNGFKVIEILMTPHGGSHNDTITTVEKKIAYTLF